MSLAEQLAVVKDQIRPRGYTQPIVSLIGQLRGDPEASVAKAREIALDWLTSRLPDVRLPAEAREWKPFEIDLPGVPLAATAFRREAERGIVDYWVARQHFHDPQVAGRLWATEITLASGLGKAFFGLRQQCNVPSKDPGFAAGIPRVVREIASKVGLIQDDHIVTGTPFIVSSEADLAAVIRLIEHRARRLPVLVATTPQGNDDPASTPINAHHIARRSTGVAHTVIIPASYTFGLTDQWGKEWSVFNGSFRTYRPGFDNEAQSPRQHPLAVPERVERQFGNGNQFENFIVTGAILDSWENLPLDEHPRSFSEIRQMVAQARAQAVVQSAAPLEEKYEAAQQQISALKNENDQWLTELTRLEESIEAYKVRLDDQARDRHNLLARIAHLEARLGDADEGLEFPDTYTEMEEWIGKHLSGRLKLHRRAVRALKSAQFEDVRLVYECLLMLATEYHEMKFGTAGAKESFDKRVAELRVEVTPTGDEGHLSGFGDTYFVMHRGQRQFLDMHVKSGNAKSPRHTLRIYFFFDEDDGQVIVGSLPEHLDNNMT